MISTYTNLLLLLQHYLTKRKLTREAQTQILLTWMRVLTILPSMKRNKKYKLKETLYRYNLPLSANSLPTRS